MAMSDSVFVSPSDSTRLVTYARPDVVGDPRGVVQAAHAVPDEINRDQIAAEVADELVAHS